MEKGRISAGQAIIIFLLVMNLCGLGGVIFYLLQDKSSTAYDESSGTQYTLYIGTNDKDTYTQKISLEEAKAMVNSICVKYVDGYTVQEAEGGWVDERGTLTQEETLIYSFKDIDETALKDIMDEVLIKLNQNSILVESSDLSCSYYSGQ